MILKNLSARLITLNVPAPNRGSFDLLPGGDAVEVPDDLGIASQFVESLVNSGDLVKIAQEKKQKGKE